MGVVKRTGPPIVHSEAAGSAGSRTSRVLSPSEANWLNSDFTEPPEVKLQANMMAFGDAGTGKSTLAAVFAPGPVAFINFDRRASHVVNEAKRLGKVVRYLDAGVPANVLKMGEVECKKYAQESLDKVTRNFEIAVRESQRGNCRTICIDTGTELAEIITLAIRGHLDKGNDYGRSKDLINREFWRLFNTAREGLAHLIILARARAVWVDNQPTNRFTFRGPEVLNDGVDWACHIRLKKSVVGRPKKEFEIEVTKAGVNIDELGAVYTSKEWDDSGGPFVLGCMRQYGTAQAEFE